MEKYYKILILIGVMCYHIEQLYCQDSMTGVITDICGERLYQCKNGACINETLICNGKRDCQDGDDEENCIAGRTNSSIFCAKTNGQCTCEDDYFGSFNEYVYLHLNCTDAGLTSFPKLLNKNSIYEIDLSDNNLTKLTPGMFEHLSGLRSFSLARNQINTIEKNAFNDIRIDEELDLSGNKLEKLTPGIFNSIGELNTSDEWSVYSTENSLRQFSILHTELLNLKDNEIKSIEPYTFSSIIGLRFLNLAGNKITKLTSGMFKGYLSLLTLHLEENEIDSIENNTFDHFERLNILNLSNNNLTKLDNHTFKNLTVLRNLSLAGNQISHIEMFTFHGLEKLEFLDLSDNNLTKLTPGMFEDLLHLDSFSLARNQINTIERNAFKSIYVGGELDLSGNKLEKLTPGIFNSIGELNTSDEWSVYSAENSLRQFIILHAKLLNLKDNEIKSVEPYTFSSIWGLRFLNLARNKITKLTSGTFKGHLRLSKLDLEENEIDSIENNTFVHFERLNFLYLNRNKLTKLKRGMFNSSNLFPQYLDLRENEIDTIESYTFIDFPNMESLDLSNNNLTKLDKHTFKNLTVLRNLSLARNQISHIEMLTFHGLQKLEFLDLSYNKLTKLENDTFKNLFVREYLSLAGNQISRIEMSTFNRVYARILNLTGNPLYELDSRLFSRLYSRMADVVVDDINICCQMGIRTCYSSNATYNYCEQIEKSIPNSIPNIELAKYYISIGVFLLAVFIIFVAVFECDICGIKKYFFPSTNVAPNDDAQL